LTTAEALRVWLPRLVGVERSVSLHLAGGRTVTAQPHDDHAAHLTRQDVTASVHYIRFELGPDDIEAFISGPVELDVAHPAYLHRVWLSPETRASLLDDLRG
jgi:hypothetical protein